MPDLLLKDEVFGIVGCAFEVHRELGCGFLEAVYQEAFEIELAAQGISFESKKPLPIYYKGRTLSKSYIADLIILGQIVVELKAERQLMPRDDAQLLHYLKATSLRVGLLINFGAHPKLEWKRFAN